jgi:2-(1,2-epoxy-1,2-dihydrophenyl)acetyl-CoA isomerase
MTYSTIQFAEDGAVATITLNRPDKLNSFTSQMHGELRDAVIRVRDGKRARCLVLTGAGRGFCAGQDLSDRVMGEGSKPIDLAHTLSTHYNPLVMTLRALEMPVIAAVNGVAAGAGANLALACDIVLAARSASFIQAFCKIGLLPDCGGTYFLPRLVGTARAMGLALLGDKLSAEQAAEWGLIWKVVDDDKLKDETTALATHFASQPTRGLALIKKAIQDSHSNSLEAQLGCEADLQRQAGRTQDYREGVAAFMGKRKPNFTGS